LRDGVLLLLEVGHLLHNELVEHLLFKSLRGNGEVKDGDLDLSLWRVRRVGKGRGHEESEVMVVGDQFVTETERIGLINLLQKHWLPSRFQLLTDILDKDPLTKLDTDFQVSQEGGVLRLVAGQVILALLLVTGEILNEFVGLVLRVNHE
jgi:hypothetical protein